MDHRGLFGRYFAVLASHRRLTGGSSAAHGGSTTTLRRPIGGSCGPVGGSTAVRRRLICGSRWLIASNGGSTTAQGKLVAAFRGSLATPGSSWWLLCDSSLVPLGLICDLGGLTASSRRLVSGLLGSTAYLCMDPRRLLGCFGGSTAGHRPFICGSRRLMDSHGDSTTSCIDL